MYDTLYDLHITGKPILTVWNKCDLPGSGEVLKDPLADRTVRFSAKTGEGKEELFSALEQLPKENRVYIHRVIPYQEAGELALIRKHGQLLSEKYGPEGIEIEAYVKWGKR